MKFEIYFEKELDHPTNLKIQEIQFIEQLLSMEIEFGCFIA